MDNLGEKWTKEQIKNIISIMEELGDNSIMNLHILA